MKKLFTLFILFCVSTIIVYGQTTHTVTIQGFSFSPQNLTINQGDTVVWKNNSSTFHTTTSGSDCNSDGKWDGNLPGEGSFSHVFNQSGNFPYFCKPHCSMGMTGMITVKKTTSVQSVTIKHNKLTITPNPAENYVLLILNDEGNSGKYVVKFYNVLGELKLSRVVVLNKKIPSKIELNELINGVYFYKLIPLNKTYRGEKLTGKILIR